MKSIKEKIIQILLPDIKAKLIEEITKDIKNDIMEELKKEPEYKQEIETLKYKLDTNKTLNVWDIIINYEVDEFDIALVGKYNNGLEWKFTESFNDSNELLKYVETHNNKLKDDVQGVTEIKFNVWYKYKSDNRRLEVERFLEIGSKKLYDIQAVQVAFKTISEFIRSNPELLI